MKRLYLTPALLALGGFLLFGASAARADCVLETGPGQVNLVNIYYLDRFGVFVDAFAQTGSDECKHERTSWTNSITSEIVKQGFAVESPEKQDINGVKITSKTYAAADISALSVTAGVDIYNYNAYGSHTAKFTDLVWIDNPNGSSSDITELPFTFCSTLSSTATGAVGSNASKFMYGDFHYGGESAAGDKRTWDDGGSYSIVHPTVGQICRTGKIIMRGKHIAFTLGLSTYTIGNVDSDPVNNVPIRQADMLATLTLDPLPEGFVCYSASGAFPQCEPCRYEANTSGVTVGYNTIQKAAEQATIQGLSEPDSGQFEYGGNVYPQCTVPQLYNYTYSRQGLGKGSLDISEPIVAGWHTHEDADPSGIFYSNDDLNWVINSQKPLYMGAKWDSTFRILPITATSIFDAVYIKDLSP